MRSFAFLATVWGVSLSVRAATISSNARCGSAFGGTTCLGTTWGSCCSSQNWCGTTSNHCLPSKGCQSAFGSCTGSSNSLKVSQDGNCGQKSGQTCLNSAFGNCCSQYGYCGRSDDYCLPSKGCQSTYGSCTNSPASSSQRSSTASRLSSSSAPLRSSINTVSTATLSRASSSTHASGSSTRTASSSPSSIQAISTNSRCGPKFGGKTCKGSKYGNCCSQYSYCGSTTDYCAANTCQKGYGYCNAASSSSSFSRLSTGSSSASRSSTSSTFTLSSTVPSSTPSSSAISLFTVSSTISTSSTLLSTAIIVSSTSVETSSSSLPVASPTPSTTNLCRPSQVISNGGFEGLGSWIYTSLDADPDEIGFKETNPRTGQFSFQAQGDTQPGEPWSTSLYQTVSVTPGQAYYLEFYVAHGVDDSCALDVYFSDHELLGGAEPGLPDAGYMDYLVPVTATLTATGQGQLRFDISCLDGGVDARVWIDDVTLTRIANLESCTPLVSSSVVPSHSPSSISPLESSTPAASPTSSSEISSSSPSPSTESSTSVASPSSSLDTPTPVVSPSSSDGLSLSSPTVTPSPSIESSTLVASPTPSALTCTPPTVGEPIANPDFECGILAPWTISGSLFNQQTTGVSGNAHTGNYAFRAVGLVPNVNYVVTLRQTVSVLTNQVYQLEFYAAQSQFGNCVIQVQFAGQLIGTARPDVAYNPFGYIIPAAATTNGGGDLTINTLCSRGGPTLTVFLDDITMKPIIA